ncbi:MAG TPA: expansin EXLX1 family cellulose-binding protein [Trebonia sp.]
MVFRRPRQRAGPGSARRRWPLIGLGAGGGAAAVAAVALAVGLGSVTGSRACAAVRAAGNTGQEATHYVLDGLPNCGYSPPADGLYVALPASEYAGAARCGSYLEVTGPAGSVRVKVIDQCPECAAGHIDLSVTAFAKLAPLSAGLISVSYATLADPVLPGPLSVQVKQGSSQYWLALLADNTGNPLTSVQVRTASGWLSLTRASYNYWVAASGAGPGPFTVRLTDSQGHQATAAGITLSPGSVQSAGTRMYGGGSDPAPSVPVRPTAVAPPPGEGPASPAVSAPPSAAAPSRTTAATASPSRTPADPSTGMSAVARQETQPLPAGPPALASLTASAPSGC